MSARGKSHNGRRITPNFDPHVSRTILQRPNAVVTIRGTLEEVDNIYRTTNQPYGQWQVHYSKPSTDPWNNFGAPPEVSTDHLQRRIIHLEQQLADFENHELLQATD